MQDAFDPNYEYEVNRDNARIIRTLERGIIDTEKFASGDPATVGDFQ